jgi:beta-lactamase class A
MYRKSGSWRHWHADSAIVERDGHRYIAVALANDNKGGHWLEQLIVAMDDLIMQSGSSRVALLD